MSLRLLLLADFVQKPAIFFFLLKTTESPSGFGRAEVVLNGKCFPSFYEDLLFNKMGEGTKSIFRTTVVTSKF